MIVKFNIIIIIAIIIEIIIIIYLIILCLFYAIKILLTIFKNKLNIEYQKVEKKKQSIKIINVIKRRRNCPR